MILNMQRILKLLLTAFILLNSILFGQLKELEVKPTTQRGAIPVNRDNPDKAALFFYTQFDDLVFWSNYGIVDIKGDPAGGKYIVIVEPVRQTMEIRRKGYKTEMIKLESLQPRDVLYFTVEPKAGQGFQGNEIAVTFQVTPPDAKITIDGAQEQLASQIKLGIGSHTVLIEKDGYSPLTKEIVVSPDNTLFTFELERVATKAVSIRSIPTGASLYLNNVVQGETDKGLFLQPAVYKVRLEKSEYLVLDTTITVSAYTPDQEFRFNLVKNRGGIMVDVVPKTAVVTLNGERINANSRYEKPPGIYTLEVSEHKYQTHRESFELKRGENKDLSVNLQKNTGVLILKVAQPNTNLKINREPIPLKDTIELDQGTYLVELTGNKFEPYSETIEIKPGSVVIRTVNLDRSTGILQLAINPPNAKVLINKEDRSGQNEIELAPAVYEVEVSAPTYNTFITGVKIEKQKTEKLKIDLVRKVGTLQFQVSPLDAEVELRSGGTLVQKWRGIKIIEGLTEGIYDIEVRNIGFLTLKKQLEIKEGKTTIEDVNLKKGFESYTVGTGKTEYELLFVEGGTYMMGCDPALDQSCEEDELPRRSVSLDGFYIGETEVTADLYATVMGMEVKGTNSQLPATDVTWFDAVAFCNRLSTMEGLKPAYLIDGSDVSCDFTSEGYRLPTEAEWEFAARGGVRSGNHKYSGGTSPVEVAVVDGNLAPASSKRKNELGLYDMSGNVWEWCWDRYDSYSPASASNPQGSLSGSTRVLRGGSAWDNEKAARVSNRREYYPEESLKSFGFRVVRSVYK